MRGFSLIELLVVILIVGILAAVAAPIYLGYIRDAKLAEGKGVAGALWTSIQAQALAGCGTALAVSTAYTRLGIRPGDGEGTTPPRWQPTGGANTLTVSCADGAYQPSVNPLFIVSGTQPDIQGLRIGLFYVPGGVPPATLRCTTDGTDPTLTGVPC